MTYKHVLFDWDGCLVDSLPVWFKVYRKVFTDMGIDLSDKDIIDVGFYHWERLHEFGDVNLDDLLQRAMAYVGTLHDEFDTHDEVHDTITYMKEKGVRIAVVTSAKKELVVPVSQLLGIYDLFDVVVDRDDVSATKPDGEPIERALSLLDGSKHQAIMIGDADVDILAGKNAGVKTAWFNPPSNEVFHPAGHFDHLEPDYSVSSMAQVRRVVLDRT